MEAGKIVSLEKELLLELKKQHRLWDLTDLADYFNVGKSTLALIRKQPDFPASVLIPYKDSAGRSRCSERWEPSSIVNFAKRKRA